MPRAVSLFSAGHSPVAGRPSHAAALVRLVEIGTHSTFANVDEFNWPTSVELEAAALALSAD
jgi:hypothetical protein